MKDEMDDKIIVINCHGSVKDIVLSLKEIVSKIENSAVADSDLKLQDGFRLESRSKKVVMTVLK